MANAVDGVAVAMGHDGAVGVSVALRGFGFGRRGRGSKEDGKREDDRDKAVHWWWSGMVEGGSSETGEIPWLRIGVVGLWFSS